ncbi:MAG: translation initiation factor IF-2 [Patescibacteria group bacterium]
MEKKNDNLIERPPVIAVMGHIDHGKSTLLDYIRKSNVVASESGGITQHISAYEVLHKTGTGEKRITFLDTPGHEAFSTLRSRGAQIADIAVLVVSAEEGVKPQTKEAYETIKEAKIPFIVAINKIDKPSADIERTKMNLAENEIYLEGFGGNVPYTPISAKTGKGIPELLDMMLLVSELEGFKGDPTVAAEGIVLENNLDPQKGTAATLVIKNGTLRQGMYIASHNALAPVRIMENFKGEKIEEASFSTPVSIIGWDNLPPVGAMFKAFASKSDAQKCAENYEAVEKIKKIEDEDTRFVIPVIIETDTTGSLEAIVGKLESLSNERAKFKIIHAGIGIISEMDIKRAVAHPNAVVFGFNTKVNLDAKDLSERAAVPLELFTVIYSLLERAEEILKSKTPKVEVEELIGSLKILKTFSVEKNRQVIGGRVESGTVKSGKDVKILRRGTEIGTGTIRELQKMKNKVGEVNEGEECGLLVESKIEIAPGDLINVVALVSR